MTKHTPLAEDDLDEYREALEAGLELEQWAIDELFDEIADEELRLVTEIHRLREENERLKEELDSHEAWKAVSEMVQEENKRLKEERTGLKGAVTYWRGRFEELEKERSLRGNGDSLRK